MARRLRPRRGPGMARPPKEDWVPLMRQEAVKRLEAGRDVKVMDIAEVLGTSPALVHFYFGDRQHLVDEAWREILWAFVDQDSERVAEFAKERDWNGVAELVRDVLSEARDATHIAHVRAAGEGMARAKEFDLMSRPLRFLARAAGKNAASTATMPAMMLV